MIFVFSGQRGWRIEVALNIKFAAKTDVGRKRRLNEDSFCVAEDIGLFLVADGMGGHSAG